MRLWYFYGCKIKERQVDVMECLKRWFIFEYRFPTEEERYDKYIWLVKLSILATAFCVLASVLAAPLALQIMSKISAFLYLFITVILWQEYWKSRTIHFAFHLLVCTAVSLYVMFYLTIFMGFPGIGVGAIVAIYANRKQFKKFLWYKGFLKYLLIGFMVSILLHIINIFPFMKVDPAILNLVKRLVLFYFLYRLLRHECGQGRPFKESIRILTLIPITFIFMLVGWLSILPFRGVSSNSLFGDENHDFLALEK